MKEDALKQKEDAAQREKVKSKKCFNMKSLRYSREKLYYVN